MCNIAVYYCGVFLPAVFVVATYTTECSRCSVEGYMNVFSWVVTGVEVRQLCLYIAHARNSNLKAELQETSRSWRTHTAGSIAVYLSK